MNMRMAMWGPALLGLLAACGGGGGGDAAGGGGGGTAVDGKAYVNSLPAWSDFAPPSQPKEEDGVEKVDASVPATVEDVVQGTKTLTCSTRKVDFHSTPGAYAFFAPPATLYAGALIQGRSLRDGPDPSALVGLPMAAYRKPVTISIPACKIPDNKRTVPATQADVEAARASILASARDQGVACEEQGSSFLKESYRNDVHKALKFGISGRYYGFSAKADGSFSKSTTETGLSVRFTQSLYNVVFEPPAIGDVFNADFTQAALDDLVNRKLMGPDNVPVYVAEVTYGRMMDFSMVSSATETEMRAAVEAAYGAAGLPGSVKGRIEGTKSDLLQNSRYSVASLGGSTDATSAMLKSLNWGDYFAYPASSDNARPISFKLKSLTDDSDAVVQELTSYNLTECSEKLADDATFAFKPTQAFSLGLGGSAQAVVLADVNGDKAKDLIVASTANGSRGELRVMLANGDGTFAAPVSASVPFPVLQSGEFQLAAGDVDQDGREDIILDARDNAVGNRVYVVFYKAGGFVFSAEQNIGGPGAWADYPMRVAQMDGVRGVDLVWNNVPASTAKNTTYIGHAVDTTVPGFDLTTQPLFVRTGSLNHFANNFSAYKHTHIADFDGDGRDDIIWEYIGGGHNYLYVARGTPTGLDFGGTGANSKNFREVGVNWPNETFVALAGDTNGDSHADIVIPRVAAPFNEGAAKVSTFATWTVQGDSSPALAYTGAYWRQDRNASADVPIADLLGRGTTPVVPYALLADVDGDGRKDLILNDRARSGTLVNRVGVGLGTATGNFSFARVQQEVDSRDWSTYQTLVGDVTGDGREDILWVNLAASTSAVVGVARGN